jgi:hypothetical protein
MKTPQSHSYWVWGCLPRRRDAIAARRSPGESGSQQVCESHFHLQRMTEIGEGVRQPWLGGSFATARDQCERGNRDREEEGEKWRQHEKWLGLAARSPF